MSKIISEIKTELYQATQMLAETRDDIKRLPSAIVIDLKLKQKEKFLTNKEIELKGLLYRETLNKAARDAEEKSVLAAIQRKLKSKKFLVISGVVASGIILLSVVGAIMYKKRTK